MKPFTDIAATSWLWLWLLPGVASGQQQTATAGALRSDAVAMMFGGDADHWLQQLMESSVAIESRVFMDRLSFFHLSPAQLQRLCAAADAEPSCSKRILLWHAMRHSRDVQTRDQLIRLLLQQDLETQVQFLNEWEQPTRFDIPILVALYQSHDARSMPIRAPTDAARREGVANGRSAANRIEMASDVRDCLVEFACRAQWSQLASEMAGWPHPFEEGSEKQNSAWHASQEQRRGEALQAQEQWLSWLIKHGVDAHRLKAFKMFSQHGASWANRKTHAGLGNELLTGLQDPKVRASAVLVVAPWVAPHRFLAEQEAEVVRLSALRAMHQQLAQEYGDPTVIYFDTKLAVWTPILKQLQESDPSARVQDAAKRLLERISECQQKSPVARQAVASGPR